MQGCRRQDRAGLDPATGEAIGTVPHAEHADHDRAPAAAEMAFHISHKSSARDRYRMMLKARDIFRSRADAVDETMPLEHVRTLPTVTPPEVRRTPLKTYMNPDFRRGHVSRET